MMTIEQALRREMEALTESKKVDLLIELTTERDELKARVSKLEARVVMNSSNSSKPPSSDGYAKPSPKSLRKPGGQKGHKATTRGQVSDPHRVEVHEPSQCTCGCSPAGTAIEQVERRQVFDLPPELIEVTEHQIASKRGYISTLRKQGQNLPDNLANALNGNPWIPPARPPS